MKSERTTKPEACYMFGATKAAQSCAWPFEGFAFKANGSCALFRHNQISCRMPIAVIPSVEIIRNEGPYFAEAKSRGGGN